MELVDQMKTNHFKTHIDYSFAEKEFNQHLKRNKYDWNEFMNGVYLQYEEFWKVQKMGRM